MPKPSAQLQLETLFLRDTGGQILSTREPQPTSGPAFVLIRSRDEVAWATHASLPDHQATVIAEFACRETPVAEWDAPPIYADRYRSIIGGKVEGGPAFYFPSSLVGGSDVVEVNDESVLQMHFKGWVAGEIEAGAAPMMAVYADASPASLCFCARRSDVAAEAGVETALAFRRRGYAGRVVSAWAGAVRASGRVPLYSTSWTNLPSRALAAKLRLQQYAVVFSVGVQAAG